jgi:uncharacterized repeat protein (TIGR02543 family)
MDDSIFTYGIAGNLRLIGFTRTGYTFYGWATSRTGTRAYTDGQEVLDLTSTPGETVTLYAVWRGISYTVAYNANGGSGNMQSSSFTYGTVANLRTNTFTRDNYVFAGWARTSSGAVVYRDGEAVSAVTSTAGETVTLYAVWSRDFYTVVYNANGGSGTMANSLFVASQTYNLRLNAYARTGYTFSGWARTQTGSVQYADGASVSGLTTAQSTITLYAVWTGIPYRVLYNNNGGEGTMAPSNFVYGTAQTLQPNTFAKTNYAFAGWATSPTATTALYTNRQSVNNLSNNGVDVTLYAVWTNQLTVNYNANNGNGTMTSSTFTFGVEQNLRKNTFTRTGYRFGGWATSPSASAVYTDEQSVSFPSTAGTSTTLYAYWLPITYTVEYNANNGYGTMNPTEFVYGTPQNLQLNTFTRSGYVFSGWATTANGTVAYQDRQSVNNLTTTHEGTVRLYAVWALGFIVAYDANGGQGTMSPTNFIRDVPQALRLNEFTRTNYKFLGWARSDNGEKLYDDGQTVDNLTNEAGGTVWLFAVWTHIYTVTYNANQGSGTTMAPTEFTYGVAQNLRSNTYTRTGYTFNGWARSSNATTREFTNGQSVNNLTETAGLTIPLYAVWVANTYTVVYNNNGGSGTMDSTSFTYDVAQNLRSNTFTRTGYTFNGWARTSNATTREFTNTQSVNNLTTTQNGTVTLYALWTPITYTVVYDRNGGEGWMADEEFTYGVARNLQANAYARETHSFRGWATSENATTAQYTDGQSVSNLRNTPGTVTLYAVWAPMYTVNYLRNGATGGDMQSSTFTYGVAENLRTNAFTYPGYSFIGWARTSTGPVEYTDGQSVSNLASTAGAIVPLYARWGTTVAEDFESGGTAWTLVNGSQTNKWYVGTATANGGTRSCYISNNSSANSYTITTTSTVHFYRDFTNIESISFDVKVQGQASYDYLNVYLVETSVTPVAGTALSNPLATYSMLGTATSWQQRTLTIPSTSKTGTKRLVFTWVNNNTTGTQPPAAIDNIKVSTTIQ